MKRNPAALKWFIWAFAAFFYFYEYILRVSPSVMVHELSEAFHISASAIGLLSAFFFYSYAPMQIPVGILMDKFGARNLLTFSSALSGIGALLFGTVSFFFLAAIGRFFIGIGASFAFVAMVFVCSHWFPKSKQASLVGIANSIGMLGAVFGQGPLAITSQFLGWRLTMISLGLLGFILALVIFSIVRNTPKSTEDDTPLEKPEKHHILKDLKYITKSGINWANSLVALLFYMTTTTLGGLWGIPFLKAAHNLDMHTAGFAMSIFFIGWMVGGPVTGIISDKLQNRRVVLLLSILVSFFAISALIYMSGLSVVFIYSLLFILGFCSGSQLLCFTLSTEFNPPSIKGSSIAFTNLLVALGSSAIQPVVGLLLDLDWQGKILEGVRVYSGKDYQEALVILPALLLIAFILCLFIPEKSHKKKINHTLTHP